MELRFMGRQNTAGAAKGTTALLRTGRLSSKSVAPTRDRGVYKLSDEERALIREGLADADKGNFASDEEVAEFLNRPIRR
jgi:hypothetical protein